MLRSLCVLLLAVLHLSSQDLVTLAPSEPELSPTEQETPIIPKKSEVKATIKYLHIISDIKYRYATTVVSSRVINPAGQAGQASFSVTLPDSAFISEFNMEIKGKVYKAYVKEKEEAKKTYEEAVQAGQAAGHVALDARDSNQFTVSVNIEAHDKVTFNLTYEQLLSRDLGRYKNAITINPQQIVDDMTITVNIEEPTAIKDLEVPELQISNEAIQDNLKKNDLAKIEQISPNHTKITWAPTPEQQKSQNSTGLSGLFIVTYDVDREQNPQQIIVDEGYFVHFFAPEKLPKLRKHVIFVLDYSGSMDGRKLEQLKDAMKKILSELESKDFFSIVVFQSLVEAWSPTKKYLTALEYAYWDSEKIAAIPKQNLTEEFVVPATPDNIEKAQSYLQNYNDLGATNIMGGLRTGLQLVKIGSDQWTNESDPPQPVIIFLTDGQPNVEEHDTDIIIDKTKRNNTKECPIFSLAFGYGADFNFLRKLSLSNNGFARNIYEAADATEQLKNFYQTVASPLLSNVTFTYLPGQVVNSTKTKQVFPVFFKGSELVVAGKINAEFIEGQTIGELSGVTADGVRSFPITIDFPFVQPRKVHVTGHLEKTWAYLTIQQLLDKVDSLDEGSEKNKTKSKALELALQYSFVTPLTSLVVVKPNETESAVDAEKVQPGLSNGGPLGGVYPLSASYPAPSGAFASAGYGVPIASHGAPGQGYITTPVLTQESLATSEKDSTTDTTGENPQTVPLSDVKWLQTILANASNTAVTVNVQGQEYKLGLNETDQTFGACQVNGADGECHHFQYCVLNVFTNEISQFIPYQCSISGNYLGVCCPKNVQSLTS